MRACVHACVQACSMLVVQTLPHQAASWLLKFVTLPLLMQ